MSTANLTDLECELTQCGEDTCRNRYWYVFLSSSLITFFGGLLGILVVRLAVLLGCRRRVSDSHRAISTSNVAMERPGMMQNNEDVPWMTAIREYSASLISAQTKIGKCLVSLSARQLTKNIQFSLE